MQVVDGSQACRLHPVVQRQSPPSRPAGYRRFVFVFIERGGRWIFGFLRKGGHDLINGATGECGRIIFVLVMKCKLIKVLNMSSYASSSINHD
jgi:hypothetical protein